jgi:hypothetical protein
MGGRCRAPKMGSHQLVDAADKARLAANAAGRNRCVRAKGTGPVAGGSGRHFPT